MISMIVKPPLAALLFCFSVSFMRTGQ